METEAEKYKFVPDGALGIPAEVAEVIKKLTDAGFEAYAVGGCVRDLLLGRKPDDWDVATNAGPEKIREIFHESFYENKFFTVTVKTASREESLKQIEVTTFRSEGRYRDKRHPSEVKPAETLEEDLSRRDFTINAMAMAIEAKGQRTKDESIVAIDPFGGKDDLAAKLIRAVGDPEERFEEDALRMFRAARLATRLGFAVEESTAAAIKKNAVWLQAVSKERVRDELSKIIMSEEAQSGLELLHNLGLLKYVIPESEEGISVTQNKHHIYTVWEHNLRSLDFAARHNFSLDVRIGALLHDVAKPRAKRGEGPDSTFYGHDVLGAKMAYQMLSRLRYPEIFTERVSKLVRWHLFRYDYEADEVQTTDSSIRRLIRNVGVENIEDLVKVRMCDRVGSGVPKAVPYRLRHFQFRVEKVLREGEAVKVTMLRVNGEDVMKMLGIQPGPKVGHVLNALLEEVLDDPEKNNREHLESRIAALGKLSDGDLVKMREQAEARVELLEDQREREIKKKYYVK